MRLFAALPLPTEVKAALVAWTQQCGAQPALRWTPAEQLHITLHFLGEVEDARLNAVIAAMDGLQLPEFPVVFDRIELLGRAGILAVAAKNSTAMAELAGAVQARLSAFTEGGHEPHKTLRPHVTIARARRDARAPDPRSLPHFAELAFSAGRFGLYRSELRPSGAVHSVVREWTLLKSV
jgi:2'-5' RNA ligase